MNQDEIKKTKARAKKMAENFVNSSQSKTHSLQIIITTCKTFGEKNNFPESFSVIKSLNENLPKKSSATLHYKTTGKFQKDNTLCGNLQSGPGLRMLIDKYGDHFENIKKDYLNLNLKVLNPPLSKNSQYLINKFQKIEELVLSYDLKKAMNSNEEINNAKYN